MLLLSGICGAFAGMTLFIQALPIKRRRVLAAMEALATLLLVSDRYAYLYHGDASRLGWWMVRISNFLVYFFTLCVVFAFTRYLSGLYVNEGGLEKPPKRLRVCDALFAVGVAMLLISQFTGFYYTFDAQNVYHRSSANLVSYICPFAIAIIQFTTILHYGRKLNRAIQFSLLLFTTVPFLAAIVQFFTFGVSLINITTGAVTALLFLYAIVDLNRALEQARQREIEFFREEHKKEHALFEQTAEALVNAIEAKDRYTTGHSQRVAEYSQRIAREVGKSPEVCEDIYFAALLHDVGKIGIPIRILNKKGKLTDEEYAQIKQHPVVGSQILSSIQQSPYLSIAARYHHERYDGRGYPEGLKGEEIPEIARIIAVADAYDAMSSTRSYRVAIPQHIVREELVKGIGAQFDPEFARAMIQLLDHDVEYHMREMESGANVMPAAAMRCETLYDEASEGIAITRKRVHARFYAKPDDDAAQPGEGLPTLIVFDALDGRVHPGEEHNKDLLYFEYARIRVDGRVEQGGARKVQVKTVEREDADGAVSRADERGQCCTFEAAKYRDHMTVRVAWAGRTTEVILALPDSSRFAYVAVSGEKCTVSSLRVEIEEAAIAEDAIPRIAEEISYIRNCPVGDVPNLQVDGWRTDATEGVPVGEGLTLAFHSMSLPTARLVWHCPFISVFSSRDGRVNGDGFREYMLMRLDGENWESDKHVENRVFVEKLPEFGGWNAWKEENKRGLDCVVEIRREGSHITMRTENLGIAVSSDTTLLDDAKDVYVALTGDQCAITNIRVLRG